jgi:hypothetical protein
MASTGVTLGHGTIVRIGRGATPTYTKLTGMKVVSFPDQPRADVDVTHLESPNQTEESIPGLRPVADWTVNKHYVEANADDILLAALELTGETVILEITPFGGDAQKWAAYVKQFTPTFPADDKMTADLTMRVMSKVA